MLVRISRDPFFDVLNSIEESVTREFGSPVGSAFFPAVDVVEADGHFELVAELPGMTKEDLAISVENGTLTLKGERKHYGFPEGTKVLRHETSTNPFSRSFQLPEEADANRISAELKDGILKIQIPKVEQALPREIQIR